MTETHWNNLKDFESSLKLMGDEEVLKSLGKLFQREKAVADAILINLQETYTRRLYAKEGYPSMFEMLVKRFGHSESAAYQRMSALKLIQAVPAAKEALARGETTMTTMADTQKFMAKWEKTTPLTAKDKEGLFNKVKGKTQREALSLFAEMNPESVLPETREKPLTAQHTLLQVTVDQETLQLLNELKVLLSHEIPDGNLNEVLKRTATVGVEQFKKLKGQSEPKRELKGVGCVKDGSKSVDGDSKENGSKFLIPVAATEVYEKNKSGSYRSEKLCGKEQGVSERISARGTRRAIPIEIRRLIFARAQHRCEFVAGGGNRCECRHQLQIDHIIPWSLGGSDHDSNLRVLCSTHNRYRTKETHGYWYESYPQSSRGKN